MTPSVFRDTLVAIFRSGNEDDSCGNLCIPRPFIAFCKGDVGAALLLSQLLYWSDRTKDADGWIAKSYADWEAELGLSEYQVKRVIKGDKRSANGFAGLKSVGVEVVLRASKHYGGAATLHYRVNREALIASVHDFVQNAPPNIVQNAIVVPPNNVKNAPPNIVQEQYTETTSTETTKESGARETHPAAGVISQPPLKELPADSKAKTPQPPNSAPSPFPGRTRFVLAVRGGQDAYADGHFIDVLKPDFIDACNAIFYTWLQALEDLGRKPDTTPRTLWEKHREAIKALAINRRTPEQVEAFVRYVYSDKYRDGFYSSNPSPITPTAISNGIAAWLQTQKPKQTIPFQTTPLYPPKVYLTPEQIAQRRADRDRILAEASS